MKKLYILSIFILSSLGIYAQPCTPDTTFDYAGIFPPILADAEINVPYSQVISLKVPLDTVVDFGGTPYPLKVDSASVISFTGIPTGFSYECNKPSCTWDGGERGCAKLTGLADSNTFKKYEIWVKTLTYFKIVGLPDQFTRVDSSEIDFKVIGGVNGIIEKASNFKLRLFPNPASQKVTLYLSDKIETNSSFELLDLTGRLVFQKNIDKVGISNYQEFDLSSLNSGMYISRVISGFQTGTSILIIE